MLRGEAIGHSDLSGQDEAMGVAFGDFEPLPAYEAVRPIFLLYVEAVDGHGLSVDEEKRARYFRERDALHLTLRDARGHIIPTDWIHIVDYGQEGRELEVKLSENVRLVQTGQI
jgi:hypothetical protein